MPTPDHGNFDFVIEIGAPAIVSVLRSTALPAPVQSDVVIPNMLRGRLIPQVAIADARLSNTPVITIDFDLAGTILRVTDLTFPPPNVGNPPPAWLSDIPIGGLVHVTVPLLLTSNVLVIDFRPAPLLGFPSVQASLDQNTILAAPYVQFLLAQAFLVGGQAGYEQARDQLLDQARIATENAARNQIRALGTVVLVPAPTLGIPITGSRLLTAPPSLHVLYALGGPLGNPALITRSMLLMSSVSGMPADAAAVCLNNTSLLRDFVRPAAAGAFGIPVASFFPLHPCLFFGPPAVVPPAVYGGPITGVSSVTLDSLIAGIDEAGSLNVITRLTVNGVAGSFTVIATVASVFAIAVTVAGGIMSMAVTPVLPPAVLERYINRLVGVRRGYPCWGLHARRCSSRD